MIALFKERVFKICFIEIVSQTKLADQYRTATLVIFPFVIAQSVDQEGFGLIQVEAMGCECPIIAGDLTAIHDNGEGLTICTAMLAVGDQHVESFNWKETLYRTQHYCDTVGKFFI